MLRSYGSIVNCARPWQAVCYFRTYSTSSSDAPPRNTRKPTSRADEGAPKESPIGRKRGRPNKEETDRARMEEFVERVLRGNKNEIVFEAATLPDSPAPEHSARTSKISTHDPSTPLCAALPPRLYQPSSHHQDLPSFLEYATRRGLSKDTNVYKGTHYEYTVAKSLASFNFTLYHKGRSNDLGIDLIGHFELPQCTRKRKQVTPELRVLVQCKAVTPNPSMIRELEGAYVGAPAGWSGEGVLALLVASNQATKGVRDALQRSRWPMGLVQVTTDGEVQQFLWNPVAASIGLEGLGVTLRYGVESSDPTNILEDGSERYDAGSNASVVKSSIALTWMGKIWRPAEFEQ